MPADPKPKEESMPSDPFDGMECDHGSDGAPGAQCRKGATHYCTGCECWRCAAHNCACDDA